MNCVELGNVDLENLVFQQSFSSRNWLSELINSARDTIVMSGYKQQQKQKHELKKSWLATRMWKSVFSIDCSNVFSRSEVYLAFA